MATRIREHLRSHVLGYAAVFIALGGAAYAAIPDSSGVFHGCRAKTDGVALNIPHSKGDLRLVQPGEPCRSYEARVSWNQQGPEGDPGVSMFATVASNGTLLSGGDVQSSEQLGNGFYRVTFNVDVSDCAGVVSAGNSPSTSNSADRNAVGTVDVAAFGANDVFVRFLEADGTDRNTSFHLVVAC